MAQKLKATGWVTDSRFCGNDRDLMGRAAQKNVISLKR